MSNTADQSSWKRRLAGCAIGCGVLIALIIAVSVGGYLWVSAPGVQIHTRVVLGPESLAVLHIDSPAHDPGIRDLTTRVVLRVQEEQQKRNREDIPAWALWIQQFSRTSARDVEQQLEANLPLDLTVTLEDLGDGLEPELLAAVNLPRFPRILRLAVWWFADRENSAQHKGRTIVRVDEAAVAFVENTLLVGETDSVVRFAIDRSGHEQQTRRPAPSRIIDLLETLDPGWDIRAAADNRDGSLQHLVAAISRLTSDDEQAWRPTAEFHQLVDGIVDLTLAADVVAHDQLKATIEISTVDEETAVQWQTATQQWIDEWNPDPKQWGEMTWQVSARSRQLTVELDVQGVAGVIETWFLSQ